MSRILTGGKQQRTDNKVPRVPCQNNSGSLTVPPFGLVRVAGWNGTNGVMKVDRPNADGQQVYVNGPAPIPPNAYGVVSMAWPLFAAYDATSGTPAVGATWGAKSGSYLLTAGKSGLSIQGSPASGRVLIAPGPTPKTWVQITDELPQLVAISGGTSDYMCPAVIATLPPNSQTFQLGAPAWVIAYINSCAPAINSILPVDLIGSDNSGVPIYVYTGTPAKVWLQMSDTSAGTVINSTAGPNPFGSPNFFAVPCFKAFALNRPFSPGLTYNAWIYPINGGKPLLQSEHVGQCFMGYNTADGQPIFAVDNSDPVYTPGPSFFSWNSQVVAPLQSVTLATLTINVPKPFGAGRLTPTGITLITYLAQGVVGIASVGGTPPINASAWITSNIGGVAGTYIANTGYATLPVSGVPNASIPIYAYLNPAGEAQTNPLNLSLMFSNLSSSSVQVWGSPVNTSGGGLQQSFVGVYPQPSIL